jgi:Mor family transcriptional regulator
LASIPFYEVKEVIGEEAAQKMMESFPCTNIYIPNRMPEFPDNETRNQYIKNLFFNSAKSVNEIADRFGLSIDRVRKIINA